MLPFILEVVLVTASGALSPGPLTLATIRKGIEQGWRAGFQVSVGHTIVEFSIVLALALGISHVLTFEISRLIIGLLGGIVLAIYGVSQLKSIWKSSLTDSCSEYGRSAIWIGLALSAFNPYFIVWWATVGLKLIVDALAYASFFGIIVMYVAHVWMDYAWLALLSHLAFKGKRLLSEKSYRVILVLLSLVMLMFAAYFIIDSIFILIS